MRGVSAAQLSARVLDQILEVVREVSTCEDVTSFRDTVVDAVQPLLDADLYHLLDVDGAAGSVDIVMGPAERALPTDVATAALRLHHPIVHHFVETGDGSAVRLSDVISHDDYHALPIYQELFRDHGVEHQLGATIPWTDDRVVALGLNRSERDFSDTDVAVVDRLRPHLIQSARNAQVRERLDELVAADPSAEPGGGVRGVALVEAGRIVDGETAVVDLLRSTFGAEAGATLVPAPVDDWSRAEGVRLDEVHERAGAELHRPLVARRSGRRVVLRYVEGVGTPDAVLVDERPHDDGDPLRQFVLTPREADVLLSLVAGNTNAQIARELDVAPGTVRKHLERIYRKLSVDSRTHAVALAYEALSVDPPHGG